MTMAPVFDFSGRHVFVAGGTSGINLGVARNFRLTENVVLALGASVTQNWVSNTLAPLYDGDPNGAMAFVRLKIS